MDLIKVIVALLMINDAGESNNRLLNEGRVLVATEEASQGQQRPKEGEGPNVKVK